ncbi:uncharacterized protein BX663DRAFT_498313 [Cokeromyces recurvatus]|uniref:uncharacterized protein n=1 Tax=Cokeromyces recurvatus TaxID=90255 RepID=UPI00221E8B5B|nr:uncharacterized protein BX663DRAFT_498313 [Cokeromyces recurvatus]KAI7905968.1 hypothetical protein BX663DRAFT_498313 [Cokeromyces recurvatus]
MTISCIICYGSLINDESCIAATLCGHVFHKNCLSEWMNCSFTCPICKKTVTPDRIIAPIFFSSVDSNGEETSNTSVRAQQMVAENATLKKQNEILLAERNTLLNKLTENRHRINILSEDLRNVTRAMRYLKQLRKVADMDDEMSSPTSQAYLRSLNSLPNKELIIATAALQIRFKLAIKKHDETTRRMHFIERDNIRLKKELEKARNQRTKPKRNAGVIILDDTDEEDNVQITSQNSTQNDNEVIVQENVQPQTQGSLQESSSTAHSSNNAHHNSSSSSLSSSSSSSNGIYSRLNAYCRNYFGRKANDDTRTSTNTTTTTINSSSDSDDSVVIDENNGKKRYTH